MRCCPGSRSRWKDMDISILAPLIGVYLFPACCLIAMMLLYMSSGRIEYLGRLLDGREDFSSNIAFETADDVALAHSLRGRRIYAWVRSS